MAKFKLRPTYTKDEFKHWFLPREGVIDSFVVENNGVITDFGSFYHLPSTIMNNSQYNLLKAAYSYYNVATKTPINDLMNDLLISAKNVSVYQVLERLYIVNVPKVGHFLSKYIIFLFAKKKFKTSNIVQIF